MKSLLFLAILISVSAFAADKKAKPEASKIAFDDVVCAKAVVEVNLPKTPPDKVAQSAYTLAHQMDMKRIKSTLEVITGEKALEDGLAIDDRKDVFAKSLVRKILAEKLKDAGLESRIELVSEGANVVAEITGKSKPNEVIEVVTHYDSTGYNGADDNGSGVAFNLELARIAQLAKFDRTIRFVFTDMEEDERQGAKGHLQLNQGKAAKIVAAIIVDTIAWGDKDRARQLAVVEVGTPAMFQGVYKAQKDLALQIAYLLGRFPVAGTVDFSLETDDSEPKTADHGIYWKGGIPAVLIGEANETGLINPGYHGAEDNLKNINWDYYKTVAFQSAGIIFALAGIEYIPEGKAIDLAKVIADLEQRHVTAPKAIPESLDWEIYEPPRSSYSSSYGSSYSSSSYEPMDLIAARKAIKKGDPEKIVVGLMPDAKDSPQVRIFVIDSQERDHWEMTSLFRKAGMEFLELAANAGVTIVDIKDKKDMLYTADTSRAFRDFYFEGELEKLKEKVAYTVRERKAPGPKTELPERVKQFMDSVGLTNYEGESTLLIGAVDKAEGKSKFYPFFIVDPKSKQALSRRGLLSLSDIELMAKWLNEKKILINFVLVSGEALELAQDDLAQLALTFASEYGKDGKSLADNLAFIGIPLEEKAAETPKGEE